MGEAELGLGSGDDDDHGARRTGWTGEVGSELAEPRSRSVSRQACEQ